MDASSTIVLLALLALIALVALTAGAEAAFAQISRSQAQEWEEEGRPGAGSLRLLLAKGEASFDDLRFLQALLIAAALLAAVVFSSRWGTVAMVIATALALLVLPPLFVAARTLAERQPERGALALARPMRVLLAMARPLLIVYRLLGQVWLHVLRPPARWISRPLARPGAEAAEEPEPVPEEWAQVAQEIRWELRDIEPARLSMIQGVLELSSVTARDVMVPRLDMIAMEAGASLEEAARLVVERGYTRIPIYEDTIDHIVGILHARDLLRALVQGQKDLDLRQIARPPIFVPESKPLSELLTEMRRNREHMAIVVDEYGGTAGLLALEDILEEIVGEIRDEHDIGKGEAEVQALGPGVYEVDARLPLAELNELLDTNLDDSEVTTVGGYLTERLGRIPVEGDTVTVNGVSMQVTATVGHRVKRIRVERIDHEGQPSQ